ncbi:hypothetical protein AAHE18_12G063500 [Arachis hypogaea]
MTKGEEDASKGRREEIAFAHRQAAAIQGLRQHRHRRPRSAADLSPPWLGCCERWAQTRKKKRGPEILTSWGGLAPPLCRSWTPSPLLKAPIVQLAAVVAFAVFPPPLQKIHHQSCWAHRP